MQSLQEQHITQSKIVKLIYVLYRKVIQETTHCQGEYVSSALRMTAFICSLDLKSLNEHVQYHYELDQSSAICQQAHEKEYMAVADLRDAYHSVSIDKEY